MLENPLEQTIPWLKPPTIFLSSIRTSTSLFIMNPIPRFPAEYSTDGSGSDNGNPATNRNQFQSMGGINTSQSIPGSGSGSGLNNGNNNDNGVYPYCSVLSQRPTAPVPRPPQPPSRNLVNGTFRELDYQCKDRGRGWREDGRRAGAAGAKRQQYRSQPYN